MNLSVLKILKTPFSFSKPKLSHNYKTCNHLPPALAPKRVIA